MQKIYYTIACITIWQTMYTMQDESKKNYERPLLSRLSRIIISTPSSYTPHIDTPGCTIEKTAPRSLTPQHSPSPSTQPYSPYVSYCPSMPPTPAPSNIAAEQLPSNVDATPTISPNLLSSFQQKAEAIIQHSLELNDDPEAIYTLCFRELKNLQAATIANLPENLHIEISTEVGVYTRKIQHLCEKALEAKLKQKHTNELEAAISGSKH